MILNWLKAVFAVIFLMPFVFGFWMILIPFNLPNAHLRLGYACQYLIGYGWAVRGFCPICKADEPSTRCIVCYGNPTKPSDRCARDKRFIWKCFKAKLERDYNATR